MFEAYSLRYLSALLVKPPPKVVYGPAPRINKSSDLCG
jgi:hypothetical protein